MTTRRLPRRDLLVALAAAPVFAVARRCGLASVARDAEAPAVEPEVRHLLTPGVAARLAQAPPRGTPQADTMGTVAALAMRVLLDHPDATLEELAQALIDYDRSSKRGDA